VDTWSMQQPWGKGGGGQSWAFGMISAFRGLQYVDILIMVGGMKLDG